MRQNRLAALAIGAVCFTGTADAGVVTAHDTFGPGYGYANGGQWIGTAAPGIYCRVGTPFVPVVTGRLSEVALALTVATDTGENRFILSVCPDEPAGRPGAPLWSASYSGLMGGFKTHVEISGIDGPLLVAGTRYWLVDEAPPDDRSIHGWYDSPTVTADLARDQLDGQGWRVWPHGIVSPDGSTLHVSALAARVGVTVPEPSMAGMALGVCSVLAIRRRRDG